MAEAKWVGTLSTTEPFNHLGLIKVRQGNSNSEVFEFKLSQKNKIIDLEDKEVFFCTSFKPYKLVEKRATVANAKEGLIQFSMDDDCMYEVGKQYAYFEIYKENVLLDTTQDFAYVVTESILKKLTNGDPYIVRLEDLLELFQEFIDSGESDFWAWFERIKDTLGEDAAGELANGLIELQDYLNHMQNKPVLPIGRIPLPEVFESGVTYTKNSDGKFVNDFSIAKTKDWSNSVEVFITCRVSVTSLGDNFNSPISFGRFLANYRSGLYGSAKSFIMTIVDSFYEFNQLSTNGLDCDLYIRSGSIGGFSWFAATKGIWSVGAAISITSWTKEADELYSTIQTTSNDILDILDRVKYNDEASPNYFTKVLSLEECQATIGTFYQDGAKVYVHKFSETTIDDHALIYSSVMFNLVNYTGKCLVMENIGMTASSYNLRPSSYDTNLFFVNCHFYRGLQNSFEIYGKFDVTLYKCISNGSSADGNNYHGDSGSVAREIDCVSFDNGTNKVVGGNTSNSSNNASTAHDGMSIFRYNCRYWNSQGGTAADVNDCLSLNIGCEIGNVAEGTLEGDKASFLFNTAGVSTPKNNQYVLDCNVTGTNIKYAISGTADTYYLNLKGSTMIQNAKELLGGWR